VFLEAEPGMAWIAAKSAAISASLIFAFIGVGLLLSTAAQTTERALVWALCVFVAVSALHDVLLIAALLRTSLPPQVVFVLAALNPSEAARVGILASVDPELSALGPVGFWLANFLGSAYAAGLAVLWPLGLGAASSWFALKRTERLDLVV
jgi:ABC-2 type transport system permease protein